MTAQAAAAETGASESPIAETSAGAPVGTSTIVGTYTRRCNHPGGGSQVASADFVVARVFRRRGVAGALGAHSLAEARRRGFQAMQLNLVLVDDWESLWRWHSLGFAIAGRVPAAFNHPGNGLTDAYIMFRKV